MHQQLSPRAPEHLLYVLPKHKPPASTAVLKDVLRVHAKFPGVVKRKHPAAVMVVPRAAAAQQRAVHPALRVAAAAAAAPRDHAHEAEATHRAVHVHPHAVARPEVDAVLHAPWQAVRNDDRRNRDGVRDRGARKCDKGTIASICAHNAQNFDRQ